MSLYLIKFANSAYFAYTYKQIFNINFINYDIHCVTYEPMICDHLLIHHLPRYT